ncbi:MAG TPA: diguanylate cyclase, partial [Kineosporiaceae bacterium]
MTGLSGTRDEVVQSLSLAWRKALAEASGTMRDGDARVSADLLAVACATGVTEPGSAEPAAGRAARLMLETRLPGPQAVRAAVSALTAVEGGQSFLGPLLARYTAAAQRQLLEHQNALHHAVHTARDRAERALRASELRFRAIFTEAAVGIAIRDLRGHIIDANPALLTMLGCTLEELRRADPRELTHPDDGEDNARNYRALVRGEVDSFRTEKCYTQRDGRVLWTNLTVFLIRNEDGSPAFDVALVEDITARYDLQARLLYQATHDALTGLPNRPLFLRRLEEVVADPRPGTRVALCFLDLDGFKFLNDARGHLVGDQVLRVVARRLAQVARRTGSLLARLAGDEFVVLLTSDPDGVRPIDLARSLLATLDAPIDVEGQLPVVVRASIGVVEVRAGEAVATDLLRAAELALHAAK